MLEPVFGTRMPPELSTMKVPTKGPRKTSDERPLVERPFRPAADQSHRQGPGTAEEPFSVPPPCAPRRWPHDFDWHAWFRNLGRQMRALREFLGVSQAELAALAGVSQGAVSRFEIGRGWFTPAVVLLKLAAALARHCRAKGHTVLSEPLVRVLDDLEEFVPVAGGRGLTPITRDGEAEALQRLFRAAPPDARRATLAILRSFAATASDTARREEP